MNEPHLSLTNHDLDRLVDDELSEAERGNLLARLDREPDGWRRCALAFLEAQSWQAACETLTPRDVAAALQVPPAPRSISAPRRGRILARWIATAAAVLAAFGIGLGAGRLEKPAGEPGQIVAGSEDAASPPVEADRPRTPSPADEPVSPFRIEGIASVGAANGASAAVPVISGPGLDERWIESLPKPLSSYAQRRLEEQGWQVQQDRRLVSVLLAGGQKLVIPIDSVEYQFVGTPVY